MTAHAQRITIVIQPSDSDEKLLKVGDAFQQILDFLRIADDAKASLDVTDVDFEWLLERASTNSPFTMSAVAEPVGPRTDISEFVEAVKQRSAEAIRRYTAGGTVPDWFTHSSFEAISSLVRRNANGLASTKIDFEGAVGSIEIDREHAELITPAIYQVVLFQEDTPARRVYGELDGRMVSVGRYRNKPAIQLMTTLYGPVWCVLSPELVGRYGGDQTLQDVWQGKRIIVYGKLNYAKGRGKPIKMDVETVTEKVTPPIDIQSVLDPDFTAGLDPAEYLDRLHGGDFG